MLAWHARSPDFYPKSGKKPSVMEMVAGGSEAEVHPQLHREFGASLGDMRPCWGCWGKEEEEEEEKRPSQ